MTFASMSLGNNVGVGRNIGAHGMGQSEGGVKCINNRIFRMWTTTENWTFGLEKPLLISDFTSSAAFSVFNEIKTAGPVVARESRLDLYCGVHMRTVVIYTALHINPEHTLSGSRPFWTQIQENHGDTGEQRRYSYTRGIIARLNTKVSRCYFTSSDTNAHQRKRYFTR